MTSLQAQLQPMEQNRRELQLVMKSSTYHGVTLSPVQMENMSKRLDDVSMKSEKLLCKLELDEVKHRLPSLTKELEEKLKTWNRGSFGSQMEVKALYEDFQVPHHLIDRHVFNVLILFSNK